MRNITYFAVRLKGKGNIFGVHFFLHLLKVFVKYYSHGSSTAGVTVAKSEQHLSGRSLITAVV